jgi:hypothetical protein
MPVRRYPVSYLVMAVLLLAICAVLLRATLAGGAAGLRATPFALGAGFMLVETKAITELALVFGSTWLVVSVVLGGVLVMAFLGNLWVSRAGAPRPLVVYGLLAACLLAGYFWRPTDWQLPRALESLVAATLATAPLLFAGIAFSRELEREPSATIVISSNLLGAIVGGLLEYNVLYVGIRGLTLLALALYGAAFASAWRGGRSAPALAAGG